MKKHNFRLVVLSALALCCAVPSLVIAQDDSEWLADKARLEKLRSENLTNEELCQKTWDILWSWSKKGNLEARAWLFFLLLPPGSHADVLHMPGRSGDYLTKIRDGLILAAHSSGVEYENKRYNERHYGITYSFFSEMPVKNIGGDTFLKCIALSQSKDCAQIAVDKKLVPSFENYAAEIDALLTQGMKPSCSFHRDP
jgi:hypothetical protein